MSELKKRIAGLSPQKRELLLRRLKTKGSAPETIGRRDPSDTELPLSFAQQRLWFIDQLEPGTSLFNLPVAARFQGKLDVAALERTLQEIVRRHESLRTTLPTANGRPVQRVLPAEARPLPIVDLGRLPEAEREEEARRLVKEEAARPFDLANGPLLRWSLVRIAAEDHLLLLTMHHVVSDGWSMGILVDEVAQLYGAFSAGRPSPLEELPIQYADFAVWQRDYLQGEVLDAQLAYWRKQLAGPLPLLELPTDRPRPATQSYRGKLLTFHYAPELTAALYALGKREGASLFMTLLAGFDLLLSRTSGQEEILVGSGIANRNRAEIEKLIGFFVNLLVMRTDLSGDPTFRELLGRVREMALSAYAHQDVPFEKLVEELQPERNLSHTPFFQTTFVLQNASRGASFELPGLKLSELSGDVTTAKYDLTLSMNESESGLTAQFEFNTDLFDDATIARLSRQLERLLTQAAADPDRRISELSLMEPEEEQELLVERNATERPFSNGVTMDALIAAQARRSPEATAVSFEGETLTYAELEARAERLGAYLAGLGVGPESLVGLAVEKSLEMVVGILGIWKAGGAFVPLDPSYPAERLAYMVEDAGLEWILTQEHLAGRLPSGGARLVRLDSEWARIAEAPAARASGACAENRAYVIYTSGSTGRPKGVEATHRGLCNLAEAQKESFGVDATSRVLQFASLSFDAAIFEIVMPLCVGARLHVARRESMLPGPALAELLRREEISIVTLSPTAWGALPDADFPALRTAISAGEACPAELVARFGPGRRLFNAYGPTETTVCATAQRCLRAEGRPPIGRPTANTRVYVLDRRMRPVPEGVPGELHIGGVGVTRGYLRRPDLTAERFVPDPFGEAGARLYKSGDLVRWLPTGELEYLGRLDEQVKVRGFRIELGEVEEALRACAGVREAAAVVREDEPGDRRIVGYVAGDAALTAAAARQASRERLPEYMVPSAVVVLESLPLTPNGKVDRKALPAPARGAQGAASGRPESELERGIAAVWKDVLKVEEVGLEDNFFDLGGHSLLVAQLQVKLKESLGLDVRIVHLFQHPTVGSLARSLGSAEAAGEKAKGRRAGEGESVAIIGMAGRFPGAAGIEELWESLAAGVESIRDLTDQELEAAGVPREVFGRPGYVKRTSSVDGIDLFDAALFGYSPREAETIDPQQRLFLEVAWEALERAGYDPERTDAAIGVYAGVRASGYILNVYRNPGFLQMVGGFQLGIGNEKDFLATRVSYKLNLKGPAYSLQTACSTSLVSVHVACRALLNGETDMALAGGSSLTVPANAGYQFEEGSILAPDGRCRAFDAQAQGTVGGDGVAVVVLKRLSDALRDGDPIAAVIRGSAVNNDGSVKVGFTAPSVKGQVQVISEALAQAGVGPESIDYVEAHGTGTVLGDPIEVAALRQVFEGRARTGSCAIGSIKTNLGHLDTAAGVAGLIKTVLALQNEKIPPSLHFQTPNPALELEKSPFFVNSELRDWKRGAKVRRAGVSSFGIGGTNAHVVLEEAPEQDASGPGRPWQLVVLSARSKSALETATGRMSRFLERSEGTELGDVAFTSQVGRRELAERRIVVARDRAGMLEALESRDARRVLSGAVKGTRPALAFLFPGQGSQHAGMGRELYETEEVFRRELDLCAELLQPQLHLDLRKLLYETEEEEAGAKLRKTALTQPALFAVEWALARLLSSFGIEPEAMVGHSLGEYVAATLAGVFRLEDALALVALRGRLIQSLAPGSMISVPLPESELAERLPRGVSLAAVNAPGLSTVSGESEAVAAFQRELEGRGLSCRALHTSHAFHSEMMEPILALFVERVRRTKLSAPAKPFFSNVTGLPIRPEEAMDPAYWGKHLRGTVRFSDAITALARTPGRVLLEVGPGQALSALARLHAGKGTPVRVVSAMRHPEEKESDRAQLLTAVGTLWLGGAAVDWAGLHRGERRRRTLLPTYPFERQSYWIDPTQEQFGEARDAKGPGARLPAGEWLTAPSWRRATRTGGERKGAARRLMLMDRQGWGEVLAAELRKRGEHVTTVAMGESFGKVGERYFVNPASPDDYRMLFDDLAAGEPFESILHLFSLGERSAAGVEGFERAQETGFLSLVHLAKELGGRYAGGIELTVVSDGLHDVTGEESLDPFKATLLGAARVIPQEYPRLRCRVLDVVVANARLTETLLAELFSEGAEVALRGGHRFVPQFEPLAAGAAPEASPRVRDGAVVLITGGLGNIGLTLAESLARDARARLVLVSRRDFPPEERWDAILASGADAKPAKTIRRLRAMKEAGGDVLVLSADVSEPQAARRVVDETLKRFGALHGVLHGAGAIGPEAFCPVQETTRETALVQFRPKVHGLLALEEALAGRALDFFVLHSSLSALLGGLGFAAYSAANVFLDAWAQARHRQDPGSPLLSIEWDGWLFVPEGTPGDAGVVPVPEHAQMAIAPEEGGGVLRSVLAYAVPRVAVSTTSLEGRAQRWLSPADEIAERADAPQAAAHERPDLSNPYAAPENEIEATIAGFWQELLGVASVGRDDHFLELGGHSLLATQFLSRLRQTYHVDVPLRLIYERATVADFANAVLAGRAGEVDDAELAELLAELEGDEESEPALAPAGDGADE